MQPVIPVDIFTGNQSLFGYSYPRLNRVKAGGSQQDLPPPPDPLGTKHKSLFRIVGKRNTWWEERLILFAEVEIESTDCWKEISPVEQLSNMVEHSTSTPYVSVMDQYGYQIGKAIGHGSYGTVYEAYFSKQKSMVAIKIISKKKASEDYLTNFYQAIETTSRHYIIMELAPSGDISDFGFSKMVAPQMQPPPTPSYRMMSCFSHLSQTYCGSFAYACPEILLGLPYNPFLSDTWSMGVILYTLVVAHLPFDDTNLKKLLRETQKEVNFPSHVQINDEIKDLIRRILRPASKRLNILEILKVSWVLKFLAEKPTSELKALEAICGPRTTEAGKSTPTPNTKSKSLTFTADKKKPASRIRSTGQIKPSKNAEKTS
ncbi:hypothetical protein Chor_009709 [Crotalus horridus]